MHIRAAGSGWAPLARPLFRALWLAQLASNVGTWMQTVGAQWLLVDVAHAAPLVALVQTASLAPTLLLVVPSGVLADLVDRRWLLLGTQAVMAGVAAVIAALTAAELITPGLLLGLTFLLGCGAAVMAPAWQAIQPELVPREQLAAAAALGGIPLLPETGTLDRTPATAWPEPALVLEPDPEQGPVLVLVTYQVPESNIDAFLTAMHRVGIFRRRTGATGWLAGVPRPGHTAGVRRGVHPALLGRASAPTR
jgi:hypothetical protein